MSRPSTLSCWLLRFACAALWVAGAAFHQPPAAAQDRTPGPPASEHRFVSMFDGRTLDGWHAVPQARSGDWSVRDGAIVGTGSADGLAYLVWHEEDLGDFELELRYRIPDKGNSGIEIRAQADPSRRRPFVGYHADVGHVGIGADVLGAWDFHFDGTRQEHACHRGTRLSIGPNDEPQVTPIPEALAEADIHDRDWNHVRIVAEGNHCRFFINGKLASEFIDNLAAGHVQRGAIGLQIHDKGMRVDFKDLRIRKLTGSQPGSASR
jgi:hypothetical protein